MLAKPTLSNRVSQLVCLRYLASEASALYENAGRPPVCWDIYRLPDTFVRYAQVGTLGESRYRKETELECMLQVAAACGQSPYRVMGTWSSLCCPELPYMFRATPPCLQPQHNISLRGALEAAGQQ